MSPYNYESVKKLLVKYAPNYVSESTGYHPADPFEPPTQDEMQLDPLFDRLMTKYCASFDKTTELAKEKWSKWVTSLDKPTKQYWTARVLECNGDGQKVVSKYLEIAAKYKDSHKYWPFSLWSARRAVMWQRRNAQRVKAAENYKLLAEIWLDNKLSHRKFGLSIADLAREKANDLLWAARYRALSGYYGGS